MTISDVVLIFQLEDLSPEIVGLAWLWTTMPSTFICYCVSINLYRELCGGINRLGSCCVGEELACRGEVANTRNQSGRS
jgi:hypothetical protein